MAATFISIVRIPEGLHELRNSLFSISREGIKRNGTGLRTLIGLERPNGSRYASPGQSEDTSAAPGMGSHFTEGLKA